MMAGKHDLTAESANRDRSTVAKRAPEGPRLFPSGAGRGFFGNVWLKRATRTRRSGTPLGRSCVSHVRKFGHEGASKFNP